MGRVIPYGYGIQCKEFENFLNINLNGIVAIIPTFCGRKVDDQLTVECFERFEIYSLYVPPEAVTQSAVQIWGTSSPEGQIVIEEHGSKTNN